MSNHATKFDIKSKRHWKHSEKSDLTSWKLDVDELGIDKSKKEKKKKQIQLFWITKTDVYKSDITNYSCCFEKNSCVLDIDGLKNEIFHISELIYKTNYNTDSMS